MKFNVVSPNFVYFSIQIRLVMKNMTANSGILVKKNSHFAKENKLRIDWQEEGKLFVCCVNSMLVMKEEK